MLIALLPLSLRDKQTITLGRLCRGPAVRLLERHSNAIAGRPQDCDSPVRRTCSASIRQAHPQSAFSRPIVVGEGLWTVAVLSPSPLPRLSTRLLSLLQRPQPRASVPHAVSIPPSCWALLLFLYVCLDYVMNYPYVCLDHDVPRALYACCPAGYCALANKLLRLFVHSPRVECLPSMP